MCSLCIYLVQDEVRIFCKIVWWNIMIFKKKIFRLKTILFIFNLKNCLFYGQCAWDTLYRRFWGILFLLRGLVYSNIRKSGCKGEKERVCVAVRVNGTICESFLCQNETKKIEFSFFLFGRSSVPSFIFKVQEEGIIFCKTFPLEKLFAKT
jgi:hypothetical protein